MLDHLLLQSDEALLLQDGGFILLQSARDEFAVKTGTGGVDGKGKRRVSVKPVPFLGKGKKPKTKIDERVEETREIHAEIAGELARELRGELDRPSEMSLSDIDREIGVLLRKVQRTQEEELLLLLLMVS